MSKFQLFALAAGIITGVLVAGIAFVPTQASAATDAAALQQATAACKGQVKEQAQYKELSLYARHKLVKKCIEETLAKH